MCKVILVSPAPDGMVSMTDDDKELSSQATKKRGFKTAENFNTLSRQLLRCANQGILRVAFFRTLSETLLESVGCDSVELRQRERNRFYRSEAIINDKLSFQFNVGRDFFDRPASVLPDLDAGHDLDELCRILLRGYTDPNSTAFTAGGSFWTGNTRNPVVISDSANIGGQGKALYVGNEYKSLAIIPFSVDIEKNSLLLLKSRQSDFFTASEITSYEGVAQNIGVALVHRYAQVALRERVKELTCLYGIAKTASRPGVSMEELLDNIVNLLPPAWLYPEISTARIFLDGHEYLAPEYAEGLSKLSSDINVQDAKRGVVEVIYREERPPLDEGPFLKEERSLLDTVAREIALIIERRQAEEDSIRLQEQLRHADRLATIGQLAAGVAHELNEPLGSILGFAQLAQKGSGVSEEMSHDLQKIISASLHAREVIKKLMVFARQTPLRKAPVSLNKIVDEGIYFLESRCAKAGIELIRKLAPDLPEITADPSQLHQVLVNLVVNSIQAMPTGGKLIIETRSTDGNVILIVQDTGTGMNGDTLKRIFIPFFTTKDVHEGTGLGLSVVHGIVSGHGGSIRVDSKVGVGTIFEVTLPIRALNGLKESENSGNGQ